MDETGRESPLQRQRRPGQESKLYLKLLAPRAGQTLHAVALNDDVDGYLTHWLNNQTVPCLGGRRQCAGCEQGLKQRWKGFLPAILAGDGTKCLLEITKGAVDECPQLRVAEPKLRGHYVKLYRRGTAQRSPVVMEVGGLAGKLVPPSSIDVQEVLLRLWGVLPVAANHVPPSVASELRDILPNIGL